MILHASITADRPEHTARLLGELLGGGAMPIRGPGEGTWLAAGPKPIGNVVEVLARGSEFHRRAGDHVETMRRTEQRHSGFHLLLESPLEEEEIMAVTKREGVSAHRTSNGLIDLIEVWIDECLLIEFVTPAMATAYYALFEPEKIDAVRHRMSRG